MPISHKHRCIFVHIPKNAGSSIEKALGVWGVDNNGSLKPHSYEILFGVDRGKALQHLTMNEIKEIGPIGSNGYYSFAFVRNPFERMVCEYHWRIKEGYKFKSFDEFIFRYFPLRKRWFQSRKDRLFQDHFTPQYQFTHTKTLGELPGMSLGGPHLKDKGKPRLYSYHSQIVDYVGRMENFEDDFRWIATRIGIDPVCPHVNKSEKVNYRPYYRKETQRLIEDAYERDLEIFKYTF